MLSTLFARHDRNSNYRLSVGHVATGQGCVSECASPTYKS